MRYRTTLSKNNIQIIFKTSFNSMKKGLVLVMALMINAVFGVAIRTIIIATHNPSIWKMADQVIRLSKDKTDYN